jgi:diguanylate cyclase (GGDEF)-like protein
LREDPSQPYEVLAGPAPGSACAEGFADSCLEGLDCVLLGASLPDATRAELLQHFAAADVAPRCSVVLLQGGAGAVNGEPWHALGALDVAREAGITDAGLRRMVGRAVERAAFTRALEARDREIASMQSELQSIFDELSESQERLKLAGDLAQYRAKHDPLTGLGNRDLFLEQLEQSIQYARRHKQVVGVLLLGLDRFRELNATLGTDAGDTVLRNVGQRVAKLTRRSDFAARMGGDEFMISLRNLSELEYAAVVAGRVITRLSAPYPVGGQELHVTPSVGIAIYPADGLTAPQLLGHADVAMEAAKLAGGGTFRFYERRMNESAYDRLLLEAALRKAIKQGELLLYYQPQVDSATRRVIGVEALVRWRHPERGLLAASEFVPIAERSDLMVALGDWVLREAVRQKLAWEQSGVGDFPISVNVSFRQMKCPDFCERIEALLREGNLDPGHLSLEITESMVMDDVDLAVAQLTRLKRAGLRVAIDDFGTGYSSLAALGYFPIDTLKIDRSFVHQIESHQRRAAIAEAVVAMARGLGFQTIAEGVETEAEFAFLQSLGCLGVQGFLVARPLPAERFADWVCS